MAALKLLNLIAITSLALFASTLNTPVNALSARHQHLNRQGAHHDIAHRARRDNSRRCKARSSSSSAPEATPTQPATTSIKVANAKVQLSTSIALTTSKSADPSPSPPPPPPPSSSPSPSPSPSPKPAPAPAAAPAPPSSGGGAGNGKIGIAWNGGNSLSLGNLVTQNTHYVYTWSPWAPTNLFGLEFVPMLWGPNQVDPFNQLVIPGYGQNLLALNEPDEPTQLNLDPASAAALWKAQVEPKKAEGYALWSPAVTSSARGEQWMDNFIAACNNGCSFTHMALHFYDTNAQNLINYVEHWHTKYGRDIVLTEFACQNFGGGAQATMDEVWAFYKVVIPWLVNQPYVTVIFPFGFLEDMGNVNPDNQLMKGGQLTALGSYIVNGPW